MSDLQATEALAAGPKRAHKPSIALVERAGQQIAPQVAGAALLASLQLPKTLTAPMFRHGQRYALRGSRVLALPAVAYEDKVKNGTDKRHANRAVAARCGSTGAYVGGTCPSWLATSTTVPGAL